MYGIQLACAVLSQREPVSSSLLALFLGLYSLGVYSRWRLITALLPVLGGFMIGWQAKL